VVQLCTDYIKDGKWIGLPIERVRMSQKTFVGRDYSLVSEAHFSVLHQLTIVEPYIDEHLSKLQRDNVGRTNVWIMKEHRRVFTT
jgi:hypothetical protein